MGPNRSGLIIPLVFLGGLPIAMAVMLLGNDLVPLQGSNLTTIDLATGLLLLIIIFPCEQGTLIVVVVGESLEAADMPCGVLAALDQLTDKQSKLRHDSSDLIDGGRGVVDAAFPLPRTTMLCLMVHSHLLFSNWNHDII